MKTSVKKIVLGLIVSATVTACGTVPVGNCSNAKGEPGKCYEDGTFRPYILGGTASPSPTGTPVPNGNHKSIDDAATKTAVYDHYLGYGLSVTEATRVSSTYYKVTFRNNSNNEIKKEDVTIEDGNIYYRNAVLLNPGPTPTPSYGTPVVKDGFVKSMSATSATIGFAAESTNSIEVRRGGNFIRTLTSEREVYLDGLSANNTYTVELKGINSNGNVFTYTYTFTTSSSNNNVPSSNLNNSLDITISQYNGVRARHTGNIDNRLNASFSNVSDNIVNLNITGGSTFNGYKFGLFIDGNEYKGSEFRRTFSGGSITFPLDALPTSLSSSKTFTLQIKGVDDNGVVGKIYDVTVKRDN